MKNRYLQFFTGSTILATLLFTGCGGETTTENVLTKQPHDTSKLNRFVSIEKDWTWNVGLRAQIGQNIILYTDFWEDIPDEIVNFQYFIDSDSDKNTGFSGSNGWEIDGADYLIENGDLYKSLSDTEWKWEYIGNFQTYQHSDVPNSINPEAHPYESVTMIHPMTDFNSFFNTKNFKVMIEAYDDNWAGNYPTITGIDTEVAGFVTGGVPDNLLTLIDGQKAVATEQVNGFKTYTIYDISDASNPKRGNTFASENENKLFKWLRVLNESELEYTVLEDEKRYKVVYNYIEN